MFTHVHLQVIPSPRHFDPRLVILYALAHRAADVAAGIVVQTECDYYYRYLEDQQH